MDMSPLKSQSNEQVNGKCDKDAKRYAKDKKAGNINSTYCRKNVLRNNKTTTNLFGESKNENTETENETAFPDLSKQTYAKVIKNSLAEKLQVMEETKICKIAY